MNPLGSDAAFYVSKDRNENVTGFSGGHVDELPRAGNSDLKTIANETAHGFRMGPEKNFLVSSVDSFWTSIRMD